MTSMLSRKFLIAAAAALLFACSHEVDQAKVESVNAPIEVVHAAAVPQLTVVSGTVRSANVSPISAKLMGNVTRVLVSEGDRVRAGLRRQHRRRLRHPRPYRRRARRPKSAITRPVAAGSLGLVVGYVALRAVCF